MNKEWIIPDIDNQFYLLLESNGTMLLENQEDVCAYLQENYSEEEVRAIEENGGLAAQYENEKYVVYKGGNDTIIVFSVCCYDQEGETLPDIENLMSFVEGCLSKTLQANTKLIVYVSQTFGTALDYVLILDDVLYEQLLKVNALHIVGTIRDYISNSKTDENGHCWKHAKIIDGEYSKIE